MLFSILGCTLVEPVVEVTSVSLNQSSIEMTIGETATLTATISPENATNKNISWSSSDTEIASVENGRVTALSAGKVVIIATTEDGGKTATCSITVKDKFIPVTGIKLNKETEELIEGESTVLIASVIPEEATNKDVTWASNDETIATVEDGKITAKKAGTTIISVSTAEGGYKAECKVIVKEKLYKVTGISLDKTFLEMTEGDTANLTATITPENATNKNVIWSSSNTEVAKVENGKVTALKEGSATITATSQDGGHEATCSVKVKAAVHPVTSISLNRTEATLTEGDITVLTVIFTPENATNKKISWSSSDSAVAKVDNGTVTAVKVGTATITATSEDGNHTATCKIEVITKEYPVTGITLDKTSLEMTEGDSANLTATITPENATNKNVIWSSSNTEVAKVENGKVTALKEGTATITATSEDGGYKANCQVTVKANIIPVTGISLNRTEVELTEGDITVLTATITPENATNKKIIWSSSDTSVAKVDNGKVTATNPGTAIITATSEDGGHKAECKVTVKEKVYSVTGITLDKTSLEMTEGDSANLTATITPENATNKNVIWSSSNQNVAKVEGGKVNAIKEGSATITVTTEDGGYKATCQVTVKKKLYPVTGISLSESSAEIFTGDTLTLAATIKPDNASNKNVVWSSSDLSVAKVKDGKVAAINPGTAIITATSEDGGYKASCKVTVIAKPIPVTGVALDKTSIEIVEGDFTEIKAIISPEDATNKNVFWSSSDKSVARVENGKVTAVNIGMATITVTTEDGGYKASCKVTVKERVYPVTGVTLNKTSLEITEGDFSELIATVSPSNATNKNVSWSSSDETIATVEHGKVTAIKPGSATITVTTEDGGYTATCQVTVKERIYPVTSVTLNITSVELKKKEKVTLTATIGPENATNKNIRWSSSNPSIATVENGVVTAIESGTATITVTTEDGGHTATCSVTVKKENDFNIGDWEDDGTDDGGTAN